MRRLAFIAILLTLAPGCSQHLERKVGATLAEIDLETPYLKAHLKNGDVFVLRHWSIDEARRSVRGMGVRLGPDRGARPEKYHVISIDDVQLFESNTVQTSPSMIAMTLVSVASAAVTMVCLTVEKACFGSCPTFYAPGEGSDALQAEGFSDAVTPALETNDIDALWRTHVTDGHLTLRMTNEAYETHVVKAADVLAVPRPPGTRVLSTGDRFWRASRLDGPVACRAAEGDCAAAVTAMDGRERTSVSDDRDLGAREVIELAFPVGDAPGARTGIVVAARQSLVTTFLFYQGLAYLGTTAGSWLAGVERAAAQRPERTAGLDRTLISALGGIEIQIARGDDWLTVGEVYETGPIATDVHLVVLPEGVRGERVRLRLPRGGWRIDRVARAALDGEVTAQRISPRAIRGSLGRDYAAGRAVATGFPIVTLRGDAYELDYAIPAGEVELFLDSRGYYLEWMRADWLREERPLAAVRMLLDPASALRELAPAWKRIEPEAEATFWGSRYARP